MFVYCEQQLTGYTISIWLLLSDWNNLSANSRQISITHYKSTLYYQTQF